MSYSKACEVTGFTTPKSLEENARLAAGLMNRMAFSAPLKMKVACQVLIDAAR